METNANTYYPRAMNSGIKKILIVDDDEDIRNLMELYLRDLNVKCSFAEDAIKGLECLRDEGKFDLLISDIMMPEMNGMEFIQHISGFYPDLPIIVCSSGGESQSDGLTASELMELALDRGATKSLDKPFTKEDLLNIVSDVGKFAV